MQQKPTTISQYRNAKSENNDCIVLFRLGSFYVMFEKDALIASKILNLKMISKNPGGGELPSCGVPISAIEQYMEKLVKNGYPVAICDQILLVPPVPSKFYFLPLFYVLLSMSNIKNHIDKQCRKLYNVLNQKACR